MKPWHIRIGKYGRAFVCPANLFAAIVIWFRGWRHTHAMWWSKPSKNQAAVDGIACWFSYILWAGIIWCFIWPFAVAMAQVPPAALKYRADLTREAHFVFGLNAPIDILAGQIHQESGWRPGVTAWDNGRGLAQFMDPTAKWVSERYQELGEPQPYNPLWAIRAMTRLDAHNLARVKADTPCDRWGAGLKAYNAGLGFILRAQRRSAEPDRWFGLTEHINAGQSAKNFEYSRLYPRWIIFKHAPKYSAWGRGVNCEGRA